MCKWILPDLVLRFKLIGKTLYFRKKALKDLCQKWIKDKFNRTKNDDHINKQIIALGFEHTKRTPGGLHPSKENSTPRACVYHLDYETFKLGMIKNYTKCVEIPEWFHHEYPKKFLSTHAKHLNPLPPIGGHDFIEEDVPKPFTIFRTTSVSINI